MSTHTTNEVLNTPQLTYSLANATPTSEDDSDCPGAPDLLAILEHSQRTSILMLKVSAAADYFSSEKQRMENPPPVLADISRFPSPFHCNNVLYIAHHNQSSTRTYITLFQRVSCQLQFIFLFSQWPPSGYLAPSSIPCPLYGKPKLDWMLTIKKPAKWPARSQKQHEFVNLNSIQDRPNLYMTNIAPCKTRGYNPRQPKISQKSLPLLLSFAS